MIIKQFTKNSVRSLVDRHSRTLQVSSKLNVVVPTSEKFSCEDGLKLLLKEFLQVYPKNSKIFIKNHFGLFVQKLKIEFKLCLKIIT